MQIQIASIEHLQDAAKQFVATMDERTVFAFYGSMGAGKTTFIKAICEELGKLPDDMNFWHFDCKFGKDENDEQEISFADIIKKVDFANENGFESFYLEIIAVAVFKEKKVSNSTLEDENSLED